MCQENIVAYLETPCGNFLERLGKPTINLRRPHLLAQSEPRTYNAT